MSPATSLGGTRDASAIRADILAQESIYRRAVDDLAGLLGRRGTALDDAAERGPAAIAACATRAERAEHAATRRDRAAARVADLHRELQALALDATNATDDPDAMTEALMPLAVDEVRVHDSSLEAFTPAPLPLGPDASPHRGSAIPRAW